MLSEREKDALLRLYADSTKHSSYQSMPQFVIEQTGLRADIQQSWRGDQCRYAWIQRVLLNEPSGLRLCDFGANTGFFALSLAHDRPYDSVTAIEANPNHARLIERVAKLTGMTNLLVRRAAIELRDIPDCGSFDVMLHLNVLHHAGADFASGVIAGPSDFAPYARLYLGQLRKLSRILVIQIGTNLWGDKGLAIVPAEDDAGRLRFLSSLLLDSGWCIRSIAYARKADGTPIEYRPMAADIVTALNRREPLTDGQLSAALTVYNLPTHTGEFYRRAIFVCCRDKHG